MNPTKPNRIRGGVSNRRSLFRALGVSGFLKDKRGDATGNISHAAKLSIHAEVSETIEDHIIPRKSQGSKQGLMFEPNVFIDSVELKRTQIDSTDKDSIVVRTIMEPYKESGSNAIKFRPIQHVVLGREVVTTDTYILKVTEEKTLLNTRAEFGTIESARLKRRGSISKVIRQDRYDTLVSGKAIKNTIKGKGKDNHGPA